MTVESAVQTGADIFAAAEKAGSTTRHAFRNDLKKVLEEVRDAGHIGGIECMSIAADADALATGYYSDLCALHLRLTELAKLRGVDLPAPLSGGR